MPFPWPALYIRGIWLRCLRYARWSRCGRCTCLGRRGHRGGCRCRRYLLILLLCYPGRYLSVGVTHRLQLSPLHRVDFQDGDVPTQGLLVALLRVIGSLTLNCLKMTINLCFILSPLYTSRVYRRLLPKLVPHFPPVCPPAPSWYLYPTVP